MKNYSVCAFKEYETVAGMIEEEPIAPISFRTTNEAESKVKEMADTGKYSSAYISWSNGDNAGYWNPVEGFNAVGKDWLSHLGN